MILFCEDCGSRNTIGPYQINGDKAVFRCSTCRYLNNFTLEDHQRPDSVLSPHEKVATGLLKTPGVLGFFLYHTQKGILQNYMPDTLSAKDLQKIGRILINNYTACFKEYRDINRQVLAIEGKNLVLQMVNRSLGLILICKSFPLTGPIEKQLDQAMQIQWEIIL